MVKAGCENGCARNISQKPSLPYSVQGQMQPRMENDLLPKGEGIKVWFCSILKKKKKRVPFEILEGKESLAIKCQFLSPCKTQSWRHFISPSAQTAVID